MFADGGIQSKDPLAAPIGDREAKDENGADQDEERLDRARRPQLSEGGA
jgi:hypothetical protein